MRTKTTKVFLSYARKDEAVAHLLASILRHRKIECLIDRALRAGRNRGIYGFGRRASRPYNEREYYFSRGEIEKRRPKMRTVESWGVRIGSVCLVVALCCMAGCRFDPSGLPSLLPHLDSSTPVADIDSSEGKVVFSAPGQLYVYHGCDCAKAQLPDGVHVKKVLTLPSEEYTHAVVYLNGWRLKFMSEESQMVGFGAAIGPPQLSGNQLTWDAVGTIQNEDADQTVELCYYYTVFAWTQSFMPEACITCEGPADICLRNSGVRPTLSAFGRYLQNPAFEPLEFVGVLPKGFGFVWGDCREEYFLQAAYHMGPSERFIYGGREYDPRPNLPPSSSGQTPVDFANKGFVSWASSAIFKNGDNPDPFVFTDLAVAVGGHNFEMIDPDYTIVPTFQVDLAGGHFMSREYTVENIPLQIAAPVLKGWNLFLPLDDEQVREIGIWIDSFKYEYDWTTRTGTLVYRVSYIYSDDENSPCYSDPGVAIFGVKQVTPD